MHIDQSRRDRNVVGAAAIAVTDLVRAAVEQATGLAGSGPAALVAVVADPGLSIDELRRVLGLTHPGTVRLVDRLVDKGWIERQHGVGRTVLLAPTPSGRAAERRLAASREAALADYLAALSDDDVHRIAVLVEPILGRTINDVDAMRRLCRLCDRGVCQNCPAEASRSTG
ncbi:MarR family winged helix-turn-helix transcriptional regulator [Mycolicibacterium stellerae]|uniref:MarR family winged helix-turn-helix transcriptional regulator n=1 Tax=Mycolicibacterium stellerae TaxID=2358193 RepID=UPI000F0B15C1|nr:MarR family transcriptional regulator [Mycolicibacterium stellerae]